MTSHDVVARLRKITGERSIGHLGTLDPMASGVLPLLMGRYTRLAQYFSAAEKSYKGKIRFGFSTDTYDAEGVMTGERSTPALSLEEVRRAASRFHGKIEQMPPPYSAKKIAGTPAYKLARAGKPVELKPASIEIVFFEIGSVVGEEAEFSMRVSAGGYVRCVAHEMGQALGCGAHLSELRRTRAGQFGLEDAFRLTELEALSGDTRELEARCVHPRALAPEMPSVSCDGMTLGRFRNGQQANLPEFTGASLVKVFAGQRDLAVIARRIAGTLFQPVVVMC